MELQAISPSKFLIFSFRIIVILLLKVWNCVLRVCLSFVCVCMFVDVCLSDASVMVCVCLSQEGPVDTGR